MIWFVIWIVLMMFWLFFGGWYGWDANKPIVLGNTIIPWLCVLIVGLVVFGVIGVPVIVIR